MSDKIKQTGKFKNLVNLAKRFWPITFILMAFSFLHHLDDYFELNAYLKHATLKWRDFLYGVFEVPINLILEFFDFPSIIILPPWPELFLLFSITIGSFFHFPKIDNYAKPLNFIFKMRQHNSRLISALGLVFLLAIMTVPSAIFISVLFKIAIYWAVLPPLMVLIIGTYFSDHIMGLLWVVKSVLAASFMLMPILIVAVSLILIAFTGILEIILPFAETFKTEALKSQN